MFELKAKSDKPDTAVFYLYGTIGMYNENTAQEVVETIERAVQAGYKNLEIRIHSVGGEVIEGFAIYQVLVSSGLNLSVYVDGIAASMASIVLLACPQGQRYIGKYGKVMIHQPRGSVYGTAEAVALFAQKLKDATQTFAQVYAERTGKDQAYVLKNWLGEKDTWFSAEQAVAAGLVGSIIEEPVVELPPTIMEASIEEYDVFFNQFIQKTTPTMENKEENKELLQLLGLAVHTDPQAIEARVKELVQAEQALVEAKIDFLCKQKKIAEQQKNKFVELAKKIGYTEVEALIATHQEPIDFYKATTAAAQAVEKKDYNWYATHQPEKLLGWAEQDALEFKTLTQGGLV